MTTESPRDRIVTVDEADNFLGVRNKTEAHKNPVPLHRAISVVIFDPERKRMLLQRRASDKPTWPLYWSNTTCTHPFEKESYLAAAERRLREEMGFSTPLTEAFRFTYEAKYDETWGEHEYDVVFVGEYSGEVKADPNEADDFKWIKINELLQDVRDNPDSYSPWFKIILEKLALDAPQG